MEIWLGNDVSFGDEQYHIDDDTRYCCTGFGGVLHFSTLSGIFSLQAPEGEEGMYLGFSHLHSFLSSIFGFGIAGVLLTKYCPDPALFASREAWEAASVNAHYIWYYFAGIGLVAAVALLIFAKTTEFIDKKKKA